MTYLTACRARATEAKTVKEAEKVVTVAAAEQVFFQACVCVCV